MPIDPEGMITISVKDFNEIIEHHKQIGLTLGRCQMIKETADADERVATEIKESREKNG